MWSDWVSGAILVACLSWVLLHLESIPETAARAGRLLRRRREPPVTHRSLDAIARDVGRLGARFHDPAVVRFAKYEGVRRAYDDALADACEALDLAHLLGVLPPGPDRDDERERVEERLRSAGWGNAA